MYFQNFLRVVSFFPLGSRYYLSDIDHTIDVVLKENLRTPGKYPSFFTLKFLAKIEWNLRLKKKAPPPPPPPLRQKNSGKYPSFLTLKFLAKTEWNSRLKRKKNTKTPEPPSLPQKKLIKSYCIFGLASVSLEE